VAQEIHYLSQLKSKPAAQAKRVEEQKAAAATEAARIAEEERLAEQRAAMAAERARLAAKFPEYRRKIEFGGK
jgi:hypothetical protein